jgi:hypothetical protein
MSEPATPLARGHWPTLVDPLVEQLSLLDRVYKEYPKGPAPANLSGRTLEPWVESRLDRFLGEFCWYARALKPERANSAPH